MDRATAALADAQWETARTCYESALQQQESPAARLGLGSALWWLGETRPSVAAHEQAYVGFRRRGDHASAAVAALSLCLTYRASLGNYAASRGWVERLSRLVDEHDLVAMRGWVALCRAVAANDLNDAPTAERHARSALAAARAGLDTDLELCALSELGAAQVQAGQVAAGAAMLDEAMAAALGGEADRPETVVFTACRSIVSCSRAFEVERAMQWVRASEPFTRRHGGLHLYTTCRTHYGTLLIGTGRWAEAEQELLTALRSGEAAEPALYGESLAKLAELRIAQGRLEEAEALLAGYEDHAAAAYPRAELHLRRGEPVPAAELLQRRLQVFGQECLESVPLRELLTIALLETGRAEGAVEVAEALSEHGARTGCLVVSARGGRALGRTLLRTGDPDAASALLGRALTTFGDLGLPLESARTHFLLARADRAARPDDAAPQAAVADARSALATFDRLGAAPDADEAAAFLRELGIRPARHATAAAPDLSRREQEVLGLLAHGLTNRDIAERLFLSRKTVEHHVRGVLTKLGLANRAEAAAYAVRRAAGGSATG